MIKDKAIQAINILERFLMLSGLKINIALMIRLISYFYLSYLKKNYTTIEHIYI